MYNPKHRQSKKATKDNKSPSRPPPQRVVRYDDSAGSSGMGGGGNVGAGVDEFDLGKVLQESWDLERTGDDEFLAKHIAFPTPRRQLEQLEYLLFKIKIKIKYFFCHVFFVFFCFFFFEYLADTKVIN
jgi:hypothetical protein